MPRPLRRRRPAVATASHIATTAGRPRVAPWTAGTHSDDAAPRTGRRILLRHGRCRALGRRRAGTARVGAPAGGLRALRAWPRRAGVNQRSGWHVDVGDLTRRVHAGVGATSAEYPHRSTEHGCQRVVEHTGDCPPTSLHCPADEFGSVVGDVEAKTNKPAIGLDGGLVAHGTMTCRRRRPRRRRRRPQSLQPLPRRSERLRCPRPRLRPPRGLSARRPQVRRPPQAQPPPAGPQ